MKLRKSRKSLTAVVLVGIAALGAPLIGSAQMGGYGMGGGGMMGGYGRGMMGGYGGGPGYGPGQAYGYPRDQRQGQLGLDSRAGQRFAQTCSQCHPLPDPRQHTAQQWPGVVARMEQHMRERNLPIPDRDSISEIDTFLAQQAHARR